MKNTCPVWKRPISQKWASTLFWLICKLCFSIKINLIYSFYVLPPIVQLSFSASRFPGLSFPVHILTAQFSHPERFMGRKSSDFLKFQDFLATGSRTVNYSVYWKSLTCSCSEEVLTSWPALLLYCSLRLSRWTILLTSSSRRLKNLSSQSAGFAGFDSCRREQVEETAYLAKPKENGTFYKKTPKIDYAHLAALMGMEHWIFKN